MLPSSKKRAKAAAWVTFVITLLYGLFVTGGGEPPTVPFSTPRILP